MENYDLNDRNVKIIVMKATKSSRKAIKLAQK